MSRDESQSTADREKWDQRYREMEEEPPTPSRLLSEMAYLLPARGAALDLACGLGGSALFLAERGFETFAWDISPVAIERLQREAMNRKVAVRAEARDIATQPPSPEQFDLITVSRFLERRLIPHLIAALKPGGLLYYQAHIREKVTGKGPKNDAYRLGENELLTLFRELRILYYREEGRVGDLSRGLRNEAMLIGMKRVG